MKGFTTLMKIAIMLVSIALVVVLVVSALPLVMGGVDLQTEEELEIIPDGLTLKVHGQYKVVSSIDQDISDLTVEAFMVSRDGTMTKDLISIGPATIDKQHPEVMIPIDADIPMAEVALFFVTDNMSSGTPGLVLPVTLHVKGTYNSNLAGVDLKMTLNIPLSSTGSFEKGMTKTTTGSSEVSHAEITLSGLESESMMSSIISSLPPGGAEFDISIGGKDISFSVDTDGDNVQLIVGTGDEDNVSIMDVVNSILDAVKEKSDETITFNYGEGDITFSPSEIDDLDPETKANAEKYISQLEGVSDSLEQFLKKYAEMGATA